MPPKDKLKNTKTGSKVHVRMQVMLSRAFQNGNFPLVRQKILFFAHYKAICPPGSIGGCEPWGGFRRGKEKSSKKKKEERKQM